MKKFFHIHERNTRRGFSIIELMISISIFTILTTSFLAGYNRFNKRISVDTLAHQIGQWVRDAQISAMGTRKTVGGTNFPGYGLHFDIASSTQFIYFADLNNNRRYDAGGTCGNAGVECEQVITLLQGNSIQSLFGDTSPGNSVTSLCSPYDTSSVFDITFRRPNPDATINGDLNGVSFPQSYSVARISVISPSGYTRVVEIWITAQVSIQ